MNLLEQQGSNRRRTWLVMAMFVAFLALLGFGFDVFYLESGGTPFPVGTLVALGIGSVSAFAGYYRGDKAVLGSSGAIPLEEAMTAASSDAERLELRQLENVVDEMAIASGLPRPRIFVVPDPDPNAFATGRDPAHASIAVTRGFLDGRTREQLQGVIAHEMSHVRNYDIRLMTVVAALVGAVVLLADWASRSMRFGGGGRGRRRNGKSSGAIGLVFLAVWLVAIILAPFIAQLLATMVSRRREYLADATGAELTRNPLALAGALAAIESANEPTQAIKRGSAHLCIADPLGRAVGLKEGFVADLLATHPPMTKRIDALREMAFQSAGPSQSSRA
ncbi:MAG: M48 family metalloprotease [Acidobacteria bacterium]|nr:M48 family metalloprotease [Acidobacteriota bacterium]